MDNIAYYKEQLEQLQLKDGNDNLSAVRKDALQTFNTLGIPTVKNEEWKYTRISSVFNKEYAIATQNTQLTTAEIDSVRLPAHENANELVFVNGIYSEALSNIRSKELVVMALDVAAGNDAYKDIVHNYFNHSSQYLKDGINALNTAFVHGGIFVFVPKNKIIEAPIYLYNITDARTEPVLSQPRSLIYIDEQAQVQFAEIYASIGSADSITNQVMEMVIAKDAHVAYYKIQNDAANAHQVSTTHIQQIGKSVVNTVTISLNGGMVRNNLHAIMEAEYAEAHLWGLYFPNKNSHIDNHTIVDNVVPNCLSNEFYKGILDGEATGVFNGKIFVRKDAQKTNAFQSNKNILLSDGASVNTKPQLEIFADDVKCSHGCTVGSLDEEALFYLEARGISRPTAIGLLLQGFAMDILEKIKLAPIRAYAEELIVNRLMQHE